MRKETKLIQSFMATDSKGNVVPLNVFQEFTTVQTNGGPETVEGLELIKTTLGASVNRKSKGVYELVGFPPIKLISDDPNAP